jgi:hypothetical protein
MSAPPCIQWLSTFGIPSEFSVGNSVQQTQDGGYIIGGRTDLSKSIQKYYCIKVRSNRAIDWAKQYDKTQVAGNAPVNDSINAAIQTADGDYALVGVVDDSSSQNQRIVIYKMDANGEPVTSKWLAMIEPPTPNMYGYMTAHDICQSLPDEGFVVTGHAELVHGDYPGMLITAKVDASGNREWIRTYSDDCKFQRTSVGHCIIQTDDGGYIIVGERGRYKGLGKDLWLIKTDAGGNVDASDPQTWDKVFTSSKNDPATGDRCNSTGYGVAQTADGGYIVTGGTDTVVPEIDEADDEQRAWLIKTDAGGNVDPNNPQTWIKTFGSVDDPHVGCSVQQTSKGVKPDGYVICGDARKVNQFFLLKTDLKGQQEWEIKLGQDKLGTPPSLDWVTDVKQTDDGGLVFVCSTVDGSSGWINLAKFQEPPIPTSLIVRWPRWKDVERLPSFPYAAIKGWLVTDADYYLGGKDVTLQYSIDGTNWHDALTQTTNNGYFEFMPWFNPIGGAHRIVFKGDACYKDSMSVPSFKWGSADLIKQRELYNKLKKP